MLSEYTGGDSASAPQRKFVYGTYIDEPILLVDSPGATEQLYYYHTNSLYSVAAMTDDTGSVTERYAYQAYGDATILAGDGSTTRNSSLLSNPFAYTGRRCDDETELYYYRARMYDAQAGRFCSRDPIGYVGSKWNLYEFVDAKPTYHAAGWVALEKGL